MTSSPTPSNPPPPPPPPPPAVEGIPPPAALSRAPCPPPPISATRPDGAFKLELLTFNGAPFKDHWAFWIPSTDNPDVGVEVHAVGNVREGFEFQIKRSFDIGSDPSERPTERIPLQWVDGRFFDEKVMLNNGVFTLDDKPVCGFEASAYKVKAPAKSLNAVDNLATHGKPVNQRDCQTWIVEAAAQLVQDGIITSEVEAFLKATKQ